MKRAANLSVDAALLDEAKALDLNLSQLFEAGLRDAVRRKKAARWRADNQDAIDESNAWVEAHGLPLAKHRPF